MNNSPAKTGVLLIVDDDIANLQVLSKFLKEAGFQVRVARNGDQAIETVKYEQPDLILLDVMMPGMDGFEVCQRLKTDPSTQDIPIIFMTALDESIDKVKGLNMGAVDYITKPFQQQEVLARIKIHTKIYWLTKKLEKKNQLLQQEIESRKKAENANEAKSQFLAQMSHELRTPLNIILGFAQVMNRDRSLGKEQQENLEVITSSGEHLLELIEDILSMSKIDSGRMTLNINSFDLHYLLDSLEEMFQISSAAKGLQLIFDREEYLPQYIETDEGKLRQVLIDLLDNAIKFTEAGRVILRVKVEGKMLMYTGMRKMAIAFEVEDTGPGVSPDQIEELFQPFVQKMNVEFQSGTGLGLAISREYVRLMGGSLTASNVIKNRGAVFKFYIQAHLASESAIEYQQQLRRVIGMAPEQPGYRILVAEDKWENRQLLVKLFSSVGLEVRSAENGREAVDLWSEFAPHLIWMDMQMPVMNGYEATKEIKSQLKGQATVIIAMTAQNFSDDRATVLDAGCDDFIQKPFQEGTLFKKMAQHLGVNYIYEEKVPSTSSQTAPELTSDDLRVMPAEWIAQLDRAALELDDEMLFRLMEQIPESNASLVNGLKDLVQNFRFDTIIDLAEQAIASDREAGSAGEENRLDKEKDL
ncbi:MAG: response regulator [Hormoscilla sp.]